MFFFSLVVCCSWKETESLKMEGVLGEFSFGMFVRRKRDITLTFHIKTDLRLKIKSCSNTYH